MDIEKLKKLYADDPEVMVSLINKELASLGDKIDSVESETKKAIGEVSQEVKDIELTVPERGEPGQDGKDYVLTEEDKRQIASAINVPVVEKVIEKRTETVIREKPIITEIVREVAVGDTPEVTLEKLNTLEDVLDFKVIKGHKTLLDKKTFTDFQDKVYTKGQIDQRWHGGGLSSVSHDATLTGNGTPANPLSVVGGGTSPGGNIYDVQINDGAGGFFGDDGFVYYLGNIGIGVLNPTVKLQVEGVGSFHDTGGNQPLFLYDLSGHYAVFNTGLLTGDYNVYLPDKSGTLAMISDLPGLETNGVPNAVQNLLNLVEGTNVTIVDDGMGNVTINASGGGSSVYTLDASNNIYSSNATPPVSGSYNLFNGYLVAGLGTSTGDYNQFTGVASGYYNSSGSNNSFYGPYSGYTNTTGSHNIAMGYGVLLPSGTGSRQLNIGNLIYGIKILDATVSGATSDIVQEAKMGLGTQTPLVRLHSVGEFATLLTPSGFTAYLTPESLITSTPTDTPVLFYQPVAPTSSGLGYDAVQTFGSGNYLGTASPQVINATVYEGRTLGGQDEVDPVGFAVTFMDDGTHDGQNFYLDWFWNYSNNSDGSTPDFLIFVNPTTGYTYKITPGTTTTFHDTATDPGSVPGYIPFTGFTSGGQTFNFDILSFGTSPSGQLYYSMTSTSSSVMDSLNNGSLMQIQHTISSAGSDGWKMIQSGVGGQMGANNITFFQEVNFSGSMTITPTHYGFQAGVDLFDRAFTDYGRNTSGGALYSSSSLTSNITDPLDGNYYYIGVGYNNGISEGARLTETINGGTEYYKDVNGSTGTVYIDALGGTFLGTPVDVTPTSRSYPAIYAENTSDDTYFVPQLTLKTTNANASQGFAMYEQNTLKAYQKHLQSGSYEFMNSNGIYRFTTLSGVGPTIQLLDSSNNYFGGFASDGSLSVRRAASAANTGLAVGPGNSSHTQILLDSTSTLPSSPINGGVEYNGNFFGTDSSVRKAFVRTSTATLLTSGKFPVATTGGFLTDSPYSNIPGILSSTTGINAKTVANTNLYTVPTGKTAYITGYVVRVTAATAITVGPSAGVGNASGTNNIAASQAMVALLTTADLFSWPIIGMSKTITAGNSAFFNLGTASTGTSQTIAVDLIGYLV